MALAYALGAPASTAAGGDQGDDQLGKGCVLRPLYAGDARQRPRWQETAVECYRRSGRVGWAWLDLNQRPHHQLNAGNRCADSRFARLRPTVGAKGMRSISPLVCVLLPWHRHRLAGGAHAPMVSLL